MGLDMYLTGDRYRTTPRQRGDLKAEQYDLGYWRKHPNLHGFIVNEFAEGRDECQEIFLTSNDLLQILDAIRSRKLPHTIGFFFGESDSSDEQRAEDTEIIEQALQWLETEDPGYWRTITYQASW